MTLDRMAQIGSFRQFDREKFGQEGLGLRLAIARKLAAAAGAGFSMESALWEGTQVSVRFHVPDDKAK